VHDNVTLSEASGTIKLNMVNRNQFPVDLSKMTYSFSLGGTEVAKTSLAKAVKMDPDGGATLEIPVSISAQQAGLGLIRMLSGSGSAYKFSGSADIDTPFGPMTVPLDKAGNCPFKR
jgi:LEA14-like dessication related protein